MIPQPILPSRVQGSLPGLQSQALCQREAHCLAPGIQSIATYSGIAIDHARGCELFDADGNRFLDTAASIGVASLGYGNAKYIRTLQAQLENLHCSSFTTRSRIRALELVISLTPHPLQRLQLYSGGSEAVESAIRLARCYTGHFEVLSFWGGFHGKTSGALAQLGNDFKHGLGPLVPGAYSSPYADCHFCPFGAFPSSCSLLCVEFAREKLKKETTGRLAAILVEPMQGTAGNIIPPPEFLLEIQKLAHEQGALLIVDEMICGFGRTGKMFGFQHSGLVPDIVTLGKGLGGGFPVSGLLTSETISQSKPWSQPSFSSSSYGGNPLACAAICASLEILEQEKLVDNSQQVGKYLLEGLNQLSLQYPFMGNIRGKGLFIGWDFLDGTGLLWSKEKCRRFFQALLRRGVISITYVPRVRINPPLSFSHEQADEFLNLLELALREAKY